MEKKIIRVGHSPDPDDAFMFYAIAHKKIDLGPYEWKDVILDIESLNQMAFKSELEVTAVSVHAYAHIADNYAIMPCGASVGDQYGPILVSSKSIPLSALPDCLIAIPGELTTAFLALKIFQPDLRHTVIPFDKIIAAVKEGAVDVGLIIHEGQITYQNHNLRLLIDLGKWWHTQTGLPLPLGIDVIRKDLGEKQMAAVTQIFKNSILYGLAHREEALRYALQYGRGLSMENADRFVGMYVNDQTVDCNADVRKGITELLRRGVHTGLYPEEPKIDFVDLFAQHLHKW